LVLEFKSQMSDKRN